MRIGRVSSGSLIFAICTESVFMFWKSDAGVFQFPSVIAPRRQVKSHERSAPSSPRKMTQVACRAGLGQSWHPTIRAGYGMLLVTGGAGFIGSNLVAALNDAGRDDVVVCD